MSEDIIRIDGVEYEMCPNAAHCTRRAQERLSARRSVSCPEGMINPCIRPKRKQTKRIEISVPVGNATIRAIEIEVVE